MATDKYASVSLDEELQARLKQVADEQAEGTNIRMKKYPQIIDFLLTFYEKYGKNKTVIGESHEATKRSNQ